MDVCSISLVTRNNHWKAQTCIHHTIPNGEEHQQWESNLLQIFQKYLISCTRVEGKYTFVSGNFINKCVYKAYEEINITIHWNIKHPCPTLRCCSAETEIDT